MVVIGIGASLGGLNACRRLLWALPRTFPAPIFIAQHRLAEGDPIFAGLLSRADGLEVVEPDDKAPLAPGVVYVAPGNYHMLVEQGGRSIALSTDAAVRFARPSIDVLFESLAYSLGREAIGIVLTGASDDGARGAEAIKRAGGRVLVQTPESAESAVAPNASLARFRPDAVLEVDAMPGVLCTWLMAQQGASE